MTCAPPHLQPVVHNRWTPAVPQQSHQLCCPFTAPHARRLAATVAAAAAAAAATCSAVMVAAVGATPATAADTAILCPTGRMIARAAGATVGCPNGAAVAALYTASATACQLAVCATAAGCASSARCLPGRQGLFERAGLALCRVATKGDAVAYAAVEVKPLSSIGADQSLTASGAACEWLS